LFSETRKHEVGINSNHLLERNGEFILKFVHTARHSPKVGFIQR